MDEAELARRAIERRAITEEQLREAKSFAEGGRSILSVLLDLGYLRADQLPALLETPAPPPPRPRRLRWIAALAVTGLLAFFWGRGCADPAPSARTVLPSPVVTDLIRDAARLSEENEKLRRQASSPDRTALDYLRAQGLQKSMDAQVQLKIASRLTPEVRSLCQEAAALLVVVAARSGLNDEEFLALGNSREVLAEWDLAFEAYLQAARKNPRQGKALLGAARAALELDRPAEALRYAQASIALKPSGEAYLLRGRSRLQSSLKEAARQDFLKARELDPSLGPAAANLIERISRE